MTLFLGMTVSLQRDDELTYRAFDLSLNALTGRHLKGIAVPFERWQRISAYDDGLSPITTRRRGSRNVAGANKFREKVRRGAIKVPDPTTAFDDAFSDALRDQGVHDIEALVNHDRSNPLGKLSTGNFRLKNVGDNLTFELELPNNTLGDAVLADINKQPNRSCEPLLAIRLKVNDRTLSAKTIPMKLPTKCWTKNIFIPMRKE